MACGMPYSCPDYMLCVSSCLSGPAPEVTQNKREEKSESARFLLLIENILSVPPKKKKSLFICFLSASSCFGFFF